jgi:hypothetical protein
VTPVRIPDAAAGWCPTCREPTVTEPGRACAWCDTTIVTLATATRRRGGGKPKGKYAKVTDAQLATLHAVYWRNGLSVRQLANHGDPPIWKRLGYATDHACANALHKLLRDRGYELRDRIEATVLASTKNGLSPRDSQERKRRRLEAGLTQKAKARNEQCVAVKQQAPRKGQQCTRPSIDGSMYCQSHDPERVAANVARCATMRARLPAKPMCSWADVRAQLDPWLAGERYPATALARATGVPQATCSRLLKDGPDRITVRLAGRLLAALDLEAAA